MARDFKIAFTLVEDLQNIIDTNLQAYLTAEATTRYRLPMPTGYPYEKNTFEKIPAILYLPDSTTVEQREAGSSVLTTLIVLHLIVKDEKNRYAKRLYLYEKALRDCINGNNHISDATAGHRDFWCDSAIYGMSRNNGSILVKDLLLNVYGRGQLTFP